MAQIKTSNFLPEVYRTETNQKFLNATLDQLVTQPDLRNINGYVGRKFAPTFKSTDNYIPEPTEFRKNYQLEPSVVVKDKVTGDVKFFSSYIDLLQQVGASGGLNNNQTRLFSGESYSYDGLFDFDKFVNFNQYYWLENGPMIVPVFASDVPTSATYIVSRDPANGSYKFSSINGVENPTIQLAYGGTYEFIVNQPGYPFWIQTDSGTSGKKLNSSLTSRNVLGVTNNGADVGTVTFSVPQPTAQDFYVNMPIAGTADLSTALSYTQIQGKRVSEIASSSESGIDGISAINQLNLKSLIFINNDLDDSKWTVNGNTIPVAKRRNAWQITMSSTNGVIDEDPIVNLNPLLQSFTIGAMQKVFVGGGVTRAETTYYLASDYLLLNLFKVVPEITATLNSLYYQDGVSEQLVGRFDLLVSDQSVINVDTDIIGAKSYQSPNGVVFTNGLKISFDTTVQPSSYQNGTYYVEGVGTGIKLIDVNLFETPEAFAINGLTQQDYITMNRASPDSNPWTRSNRWFHIDIITSSAKYNNTMPLLDQNLRARRPIIEFEAGVQLYNFGKVAKKPVDLINFTVTDSRNTVELQPYGFQLDGVTLEQDMRVIFASDYDPTVRDLIYVVNIVFIQHLSQNVINLVPADDSIVAANNNVIVLSGPYTGVQYYYNGGSWIQGQQKTQINQAPLFDVFDINGYSIGDTAVYTNSTFVGTKLFSYSIGTGANDSVLGFPLSYRTFNQIGDIQFTNDYDSDTFSYVNGNGVAQTGVQINTVGWLVQNYSLTDSKIRNSWTTNVEKSKQFQVISGIYDGNNSYFQIDITNDTESTVPYFRVYRNALQISAWEIVTVGVLQYIHITDPSLTENDQIDIMIYSSTQVSDLGYYEVPFNLDYNSQNNNFTTLTLGQLRNHISTMVANSNQVTGNFPGNSNLRDLSIKQQGGSILQHASPVLYSELFLIDQNANFIDSIELARREYSKLKNKIVELSVRTSGLDFTNIPALLDTLLKTINSAKNKSFPWYYSDMVPYGDIKNTVTYTVQSSEITDYEISSIFSDITLGVKAVLVYLNNVQLTKGQDYSFDTTRAGVTIHVPLTAGDTLTIYEYSSTDGNYIPETPTKLGLYPKYTPKKFYDTSYVTPIYVIQGHDGSITPAFGDFRDDLLLEFEKRIYNNIKVDPSKVVLNIHDYLPGKFRTTEYSNNEFTQLLTNSFLLWAGNNKVDYITNTTFVASNPFTWCYNQFSDVINGERLPGHWRAIYKYFYDTDRPNTAPWEMIGLTEQPTWWEARYGTAPYTGGNMVLWNDMEAGYIYNDGNPYTDSRFARPGLINIIPVDYTGALVPPSAIVVRALNSSQTSSNFKIGDQGPVETAWRRSSDFPYAFQQALALAKPAFYFGTLVNTNQYYKNTTLNQYIESTTLQRVGPTDININGVVKNGAVVRGAGYINWIAEHLRNQGIDPGTKLNQFFNDLTVQLAYKMAGYTDKSFIQVIAEQSSPNSTNAGVVIPNENYNIQLYKSTPTAAVVYSAVVVERTSTGYTVSGYDNTAPYFTIIPSLANGNNYQVPVINDTAIIYQDYQNYKVAIPYGYEFTTRQQVVDFLVSYQRYLQGIGFGFTDVDPDLGVQRDWILSAKEFLTWAQQGWAASSVLVLSPAMDHITLYTSSGVVDKIQNQPTQSCVLDTGYNFIKYSQMSVNRSSNVDGNIFKITVNDGQTVGLVRLAIVEYEHVIIFDNVDIFNDVIYVPELGNRQYRLKLVGKKTGSWTGDMNPPGFIFNNTTVDDWQQGKDYLMGTIVRYKNNNYTALQNVLAATTFDPNLWAQLSSAELQTGLLPNFSYNAEKFNRFNDIDNPEVLGDFHLYSDSAIGFQPRKYLTDFGLNEVTQAKFYQGYIRQKGTMNAINAFNAVGVNGATSNINVYEEWAMRVGEYGAIANNRSVDLILTEGTFNGDPVTFTLLANGSSVSANSVIGVYPTQLYKTEGPYTPNIYKNRDASSNYQNDIPTAGYVDFTDANVTIFDMFNISSLNANISQLNIGTTIWAAKDPSRNWNIYRITETDVSVVNVTYSVDNIGVMTTNRPHGRSQGDFIVLNEYDDRINGAYAVYNIIDAYNFSVVFQGQAATQIKQAIKITSVGALYYLQSVRIKTATDLSSITPLHNWMDNDKLWVDSDYVTGGWAVYNKTTPWKGNVSIFNANMKLSANSYVSNSGFGKVVALSADGSYAVASSQYSNSKGNVFAFVSNVSNGHTYTMVANIGPRSGGTRFGAALDTAGNVIYIGNPGDGATQSGFVHIHRFDGNVSFPWTQTLTSPWPNSTGDLYGASLSASADGTWLYVAAPTAGNVYVYQGNATSYYTYANTITVGSSAAAQFGYSLKTTSTGNQVAVSAPYQSVNGVAGAGAVYVFDRSIESFYANGTTYTTAHPISNTSKLTVNGNLVTTGYTAVANTLTFTNAPVVGSLITIETNYFQLLETLTSPTPISGAAFGTATWISGNDADVFVSSPGYSAPGYFSGIVHRFVNQGASYGTITGSTFNGVVNLGDSIRINGANVAFTAGNVITAANNINNAQIPGVTAVAQSYGALTITSNVATPYQRLIIGPGNGNAMANLGLNVFTEVQSIKHPVEDEDVSEFGISVISSPDSSSLVITASQGNAFNPVSFDTDNTEFDTGSTLFFDGINGSGAVYVYGLVNQSLSSTVYDQYVLVERVPNSSLSENDQFGYSVAMNNNTMLVGAPGDSNTFPYDVSNNWITFNSINGSPAPIANAGTFYIYQNLTGSAGWDLVKQQTDKVDIDSISRLYLYNANSQVILTNLDFIDPAKGRILGAAEADLDYITDYDPATYNSVGTIDGIPNLANNVDHFWGDEHLTKTWWNTGLVRYTEYEQGSIDYRARNWGRTFPGSKIQVCEWVASNTPPSMYTGSGTPLYPDNSAYSIATTINPETKLPKSTYYFWVTGKNSLESSSVHKNTISTIQDLIANPQAQSIPYATVLRDDTVSLHGITKHLKGNSTVLHMDYDVLRNTNVIHSEYQLVQEGNSNSKIPTRIIEKIIDSLSGIDTNGFSVPDSSLTLQQKLGLGVAPNQTVFVDRLSALKNWVEFVNAVLIQYPIVKEFNINSLYDSAPEPDSINYDIRVATYAELSYINTANISTSYVVLVAKDETQNGLWALYSWNGLAWTTSTANTQSYYTPAYWNFVDWYASTYDSSVLPTYVIENQTAVASLQLVAGDTVKVLNSGNGEFVVYQVNSDGTTTVVGIENGTIQLSSALYETTKPANEIRVIFNAIRNYIFINALALYFNQMFFSVVNYILTEQTSVDWVFKTSFVGIVHYFKTLGQPAAYVPDDQTYYENYINEVKPYRTSIREYLLQYDGNDEYFGDTTDFDIPSTYISSYGGYRSPDGSNANDATWLATLPQYSQWSNNHTYSIGTVVPTNIGANYTLPPTVTVVGGGGTGAVINAVVDFNTGTISRYDVVNPGHGYTSNPTIFVNGTGAGATAYAQLVNHYQVDSLPTVEIFTTSNVTVTAGNIISQANTTAYGTVYSSNYGNVITLVDVVGTFNTVDYLYKDLANLQTNASSISSYTQFINNSYNTVRNIGTTIKFDRTSYSSNIISWTPNSTIKTGSIVSFGGDAYLTLPNRYELISLSGNITTSAGNIIKDLTTGAQATVYSGITNSNVVAVHAESVVGTFGGYLFDTGNSAVSVNVNLTVHSTGITATNSYVYSTAILTMSSPIAASVGQYITQTGTNANAQVISISANTQIITVGNLTSNFVRRNGNILVNGVSTGTVPVVVNNVFDYTKYQLVDAETFTNAADRITSYYNPTAGMPGKDLTQLMSGIEYPGVQVDGVTYEANTSVFSSNLIYTWANSNAIFSSNIQLSLVALQVSASTVIYAGNIVTQPATGAHGTVYATSTQNIITLENVVGTFSTNPSYYLTANTANINVTVLGSSPFQQITNQNLVDFTKNGYSSGQPLVVTDIDTNSNVQVTITEVDSWRILVSGNLPTTTVGANLSLKYYDYTNPTYFDTSISNTYKTTNTLTTIDGGAYYDTYSSHAPEELVPGVTFDNLNMTVYTGMVNLGDGVGLPNPPYVGNVRYTSNVGYRIVQNMNGNISSRNYKLWPSYYGISASHITTLTANLNISDSNIKVANVLTLTPPSLSTLTPGTVFINGEKIYFWGIDYTNGTLTSIRRAVDGTGAPQVHPVGSQVVDTNTSQLIPGGNAVSTTTWLNAPGGAPRTILFYDALRNPYTWVTKAGDSLTTVGSQSDSVTDGSGLQGSTSPQALFLKRLT